MGERRLLAEIKNITGGKIYVFAHFQETFVCCAHAHCGAALDPLWYRLLGIHANDKGRFGRWRCLLVAPAAGEVEASRAVVGMVP